MVMEVLFVIFIASCIVIAGFLSNVLFRRTGFPDIVLLIFLGILLGPILKLFSFESLLPVMPYLTALTLVMILSKGGLEMDIGRAVSRAPRAIVLGTLYVSLCTLVISLIVEYALKLGWLRSLMLGAMVPGTSSVVIIPLMSKMRGEKETSMTLTLETEVTDVLNIVFVTSILQAYLTGMVAAGNILSSIASRFSVGIVFGFILGGLWIAVLYLARNEEYVYMFTLGVILLQYAVVEWLGGSGILSSFSFALVLGNDRTFISFMKMKIEPIESKVRNFIEGIQSELSFLMRAFFFVSLGLMYQFSIDGILIASGLFLVSLVIRYVAASVSMWRSKLSANKVFMTLMCGQGLAHATISTLPLQSGVPGASIYTMVVLNIIVFSNIVTSASAFLFMYKNRRSETKKPSNTKPT